MFKKFPSIVQFSNVVKHVRDNCKFHNKPLPTIEFSGSVKLHGTNSGLGFSKDKIWYQSRERLLSYESDNAGFAMWGMSNEDSLKKIYTHICDKENIEHDSFYIFGEWCGPSIQKGVSVSQLPEKKFAIFEMVFVKADQEFKIDHVIYHKFINDLLQNVVVIDAIVKPLTVTIDFNEPSSVQNFLLEETLKVEEECPFGKYFGISGVGEGIVYTSCDCDLPKFKVKGEKHSSSKVKTLHELTEAEISAKASAKEFVDFALSENRLKQGISKLEEMGHEVSVKSMGHYLKWVGNDILEECKDTLIESGLERKVVMPVIADKAKFWYFNYLNNL